ncbi:F-box only protein 31-like [Saccostrea echinata]|uniref:F-box only protein 31-like n=1 Tax=Saccostrea echinata TaxID=191078 RepID=UPI002A81AFE5|nr:F-box only protein 31-like [Saccostrea echinata]
MTELLLLPPELLTRILQNIPGKDFQNVCLSCKQLRDLAYDESIWKIKCEEEYKFKSITGWNVTYRDVYHKVLRLYGDLVGLWWRDFTHYGGLMQVKFDNGCIKGVELLAPLSPHVERPLRRKTMFTISLTSSGKLEIVSVHNTPYKEIPCSITVEEDELRGRILEYRCPKQEHNWETMNQWLEEELNSEEAMDIYLHCYRIRGKKYLSSRHFYRWTPLAVPWSRPNVPIQPGLFKGTYSAHGIEILSLDYNEDMTEATATKITGDPNIPATKVSVKAELTSTLVLTASQQETLSALLEASEPNTQHPLPETQPFKLPVDCYDRDIPNIPKTCTFRCNALGQIAADGYVNPSFSKAQFVVFDENTFGMIWLELLSFSIYARVKYEDIND